MSLRAALALLCAVPSVAIAAEASVVGVIFDGLSGLPKANVEVRVGERTLVSDASGRILGSVPAGEWPVMVGGMSAGTFRFVEGATTEILLTVGNSLQSLVEEPPLPPEEEVEAVPGELEGMVVDEEEGTPVVGARIFVQGARGEARSDDKGMFRLTVPSGTRDISVVHDRYSTSVLRGVEIAPNDTTGVTVKLIPAGLALEDFLVRAPRIEGSTAALLEERQNSSTVGDMLGAEQIARSGDSNAAAALRRVAGLTLVDGKYVFVRGLGGRYSSALINGAMMPSPEPERRVIPLDMFPAGVLESVVVQKGYSPDMPGEFGGGTIQLRTRGTPLAPTFRVKLQAGYLSGSTFTQGLGYQGGPGDWIGAGAKARSLPDPIAQASADQRLAPGDRFSDTGYSAEELEQFGEMMPNVWTPQQQFVLPDLQIGITAGTPIGERAGWMAGISYKNTWDNDQMVQRYYTVGANQSLELSNEYAFDTTVNNVDLSGILVFEGRPADGHTLKSTSMVLRRTSNEARTYEGYYRDASTDIRVNRLRYIERMLLVQQLTGEHNWGKGWGLDWRYTLARASRIEPDRRETRFDLTDTTDGTVWLLSDRPEGNQRVFSDLVDWGHDAGVDMTIPLGQSNLEFPRQLKVGGVFAYKTRGVDTRRYKYKHKGPNSRDGAILSQEAEQIFTPENIGSDGFQFEEITRETDNYSAFSELGAGYAMFELPFAHWFRMMAGARAEYSNQNVSTFALFMPEAVPVQASLKTFDILPALSMTFNPREDMNIRLGYGRSVSRPDFREMSPATFNDVTGGRQIVGNPDLERALLDHVDLRWEWYPKAGESLSAGAFYKHFLNPIETIVLVSANSSVSWENADSAWLAGVEIDGRKTFDFFGGKGENFYMAGNVAFIYSRVDLGENSGAQTSNVRALQGQSPYVVNASLGWDDPKSGSFATILYNVSGPRIVEVGANNAPDTYEMPVHYLDAVAGIGVGGGWRIGVKVQNILNSWERLKMGDEYTMERRGGVRASLSLSWGL